MKRHPGEKNRRGGVGGSVWDYFRGRQAMGQPGTFSSGTGGMFGSATYLKPQMRAVRMSHLEKAFISLRRRSANS